MKMIVVNEEKLICFLYLLLRDELPSGKVWRLIKAAGDAEVSAFSDSDIESLSRRIVKELSRGEIVR